MIIKGKNSTPTYWLTRLIGILSHINDFNFYGGDAKLCDWLIDYDPLFTVEKLLCRVK